MEREKLLENIKLQIKKGNHIVGVATGTGMAAKCAKEGKADFILVLNSGRFRQMGRSSLAGYLPFSNSNDMVMEFSTKEIIPLVKDIPIIFGLNATDPTKNIERYIDKIKSMGFSGINNYPTVGLIDGQLREALEEDGCNYSMEVEAIRIAHKKGMVTVAFVFNEAQAELMINAGADAICVHLGLTGGGLIGAKKVLSLEEAKSKVAKIFCKCNQLKPSIIKLIYGGPVKTPIDVQYMYSNNEDVMGYIGGSAFDRIQSEKSIINTTKAFKISAQIEEDTLMAKMLAGVTKHYNYVEFVKEYVAYNYMNDISFLDLAKVANVSRGYLSSLFKTEVGCNFPEYLVKFRINKALEIMNKENIQLSEIASLVGYRDYAQFSKIFKKYKGCSPKQYKSKNIT